MRELNSHPTEETDVPVAPACDHASAFPGLDRGRRYIRMLRDIGIDVSGRVVADLGTGFGLIALSAARNGATRVVAVDAETSRLSQVRRQADQQGLPVQTVLGNLLEPPFERPFADVVFLIGVVEYAGLWDPSRPVRDLQRNIFETAYRILKPGGSLAFASKNRSWPWFGIKDSNTRQPLVNFLPRSAADAVSQRLDGKPYREWVHSAEGWVSIIKDAGFPQVTSYRPYFTYYYPLMLEEHPSLKTLPGVLARGKRITDPREERLILGRAWRLKASLMAVTGSLGYPISHSVIVKATK